MEGVAKTLRVVPSKMTMIVARVLRVMVLPAVIDMKRGRRKRVIFFSFVAELIDCNDTPYRLKMSSPQTKEPRVRRVEPLRNFHLEAAWLEVPVVSSEKCGGCSNTTVANKA